MISERNATGRQRARVSLLSKYYNQRFAHFHRGTDFSKIGKGQVRAYSLLAMLIVTDHVTIQICYMSMQHLRSLGRCCIVNRTLGNVRFGRL
jgi:hypothetical protein